MPHPFEASPGELARRIDEYVDSVYAEIESQFLVLPKGNAFVEYQRFAEAYERLKATTGNFHDFSPTTVWAAMVEDALVFVIVRTILGMTPPEWAELAASDLGSDVDQGAARSFDQSARTDRDFIRRVSAAGGKSLNRLQAMVEVACKYIATPAPPGAADTVHRLNKADTVEGLASIQHAADTHIPYAVLLYERYLGRPFASHRDSVSELIGDVMESAVESRLSAGHITFRKTKRAEKVPGFDQAPDFIVPDEFAPEAVIEAKIAGDDGTARDKFTRIIHLTELSSRRIAEGKPGFEVIACIDGRGFRVRREDMRRLLLASNGKVFTLRTMDQLIPHTRLAKFLPKPPAP